MTHCVYSITRNIADLITNVVNRTRAYIQKNGLKSLIIGISGGIDSAVAAALCREAMAGTDVKIIGRSIPIVGNKVSETLRALAVGKALCHDFKIVPFDAIYSHFAAIFAEEEGFSEGQTGDIQRGNIKARIRMAYLYHIAHLNDGMVISTDNFTEYQLGFWTLHGDVGDFGPTQELWKTEIYNMARLLTLGYRQEGHLDMASSLKTCIDAVPTDGLGITESDLDQIGAGSYHEVDDLLIRYLNGSSDAALLKHPVITRHISAQPKRNNPIFLNRKDII